MVNSIAKCIVLGIVGIGALQVNGQAGEWSIIKQKTIVSDTELIDEIKQSIEKKIEESEDMKWMTSQNVVLEVKYQLGHATVNLASEVTQYGGGTHMEYMLGKLIMSAVFENKEVDTLTILIEGTEDAFPEGSDYSYCTRKHYEAYYTTGE